MCVKHLALPNNNVVAIGCDDFPREEVSLRRSRPFTLESERRANFFWRHIRTNVGFVKCSANLEEKVIRLFSLFFLVYFFCHAGSPSEDPQNQLE